MTEDPEVEVTLGTGRLLGLFFGMVVVCAIFFGLGYSLGRNSAAPAPAVAQAAPAQPAAAEEKPSAAIPVPEATEAPVETPSQDSLTFYKSVEKKDAEAKLTPAEEAAPKKKAAPEPRPMGGYVVQVAAVTKQEDAEALVNALRKKSYPVFLASTTGDSFYRVQVGPFPDQNEARAMKDRLAADGYNAILKK